MTKPKPTTQSIESLDYNDCMQYVEEKYGYVSRDYAGRYASRDKTNDVLKELCEKHGHPFECTQTGFNKDHPNYLQLCKTNKLVWDEYETLQPPYQDFWHWVVDTYEIHNGCYFYMSSEQLDCCEEDFQKKILQDLLNEFGGEEQEIHFYVSW